MFDACCGQGEPNLDMFMIAIVRWQASKLSVRDTECHCCSQFALYLEKLIVRAIFCSFASWCTLLYHTLFQHTC